MKILEKGCENHGREIPDRGILPIEDTRQMRARNSQGKIRKLESFRCQQIVVCIGKYFSRVNKQPPPPSPSRPIALSAAVLFSSDYRLQLRVKRFISATGRNESGIFLGRKHSRGYHALDTGRVQLFRAASPPERKRRIISAGSATQRLGWDKDRVVNHAGARFEQNRQCVLRRESRDKTWETPRSLGKGEREITVRAALDKRERERNVRVFQRRRRREIRVDRGGKRTREGAKGGRKGDANHHRLSFVLSRLCALFLRVPRTRWSFVVLLLLPRRSF